MNLNINSKLIPIKSGQNSKRRYGFTLIELLVVISIIVILITMGVTSFATAQRKGRDAKRKADLREIKNSLEQYYSVCGFVYPTPASSSYDPIVCWSPVTFGILENMPKDPRSGADYECPEVVSDNCNNDNFKVCTELESDLPSTYCVNSSQ